jgi:hypothetical protein
MTEMTKMARVQFDVYRPDGVSDDQFREWVYFEMGLITISSYGDNPLEFAEITSRAKNVSILIE